MKTLLLILLFGSCTNLFSQDFYFKPANSAVLVSSENKMLMRQCSRSYPEKLGKYWQPTQANIDTLEKYFKKILDLPSTGCCIVDRYISDLSNYAYQYIGITSKKRRYIYVNAIRLPEYSRWLSYGRNLSVNAAWYCDGGESFWGATFDIETKEFDQLNFNGGR